MTRRLLLGLTALALFAAAGCHPWHPRPPHPRRVIRQVPPPAVSSPAELPR